MAFSNNESYNTYTLCDNRSNGLNTIYGGFNNFNGNNPFEDDDSDEVNIFDKICASNRTYNKSSISYNGVESYNDNLSKLSYNRNYSSGISYNRNYSSNLPYNYSSGIAYYDGRKRINFEKEVKQGDYFNTQNQENHPTKVPRDFANVNHIWSNEEHLEDNEKNNNHKNKKNKNNNKNFIKPF